MALHEAGRPVRVLSLPHGAGDTLDALRHTFLEWHAQNLGCFRIEAQERLAAAEKFDYDMASGTSPDVIQSLPAPSMQMRSAAAFVKVRRMARGSMSAVRRRA